jgi:AcrR family transcriptional regulator
MPHPRFTLSVNHASGPSPLHCSPDPVLRKLRGSLLILRTDEQAPQLLRGHPGRGCNAIRRSVTQVLKEALADSPDPADGVRAFIEAAAHVLRDSDYLFGCPVAPIVLDSPESSALAEVCQEALEEWQQVLVEGLGSGGIERARAESLATMIVCGLEGGLILARARRDIAPLDAVAEELASMVQSALPRSTPA